MSVTMKQVRQLLDPDEPDYAEAAKLGSAAVPHLEALVRTAEPMLASKATYLASLILAEGSENVVRAAAQSAEPIVRVAAAAASRNMRANIAGEVQAMLKDDPDQGVRKLAMRSAMSEDEVVVARKPAATKASRSAPVVDAGFSGAGGGSIDGSATSAPAQARDSASDGAVGMGGGSIGGQPTTGFRDDQPRSSDGGQGDGGGTLEANGDTASEELRGNTHQSRAMNGAGMNGGNGQMPESMPAFFGGGQV